VFSKGVKIIACLMCLLVFAAPAGNLFQINSYAAASKDDPDSMRKEIDRLTKKIAENQKKIASAKSEKGNIESVTKLLQEDIEDTSKKIDAILKKIGDFQKQIDSLGGSIKTLTGQIETGEADLKDRLLAIYMLGDTSNLEILLSADSLDDFIAKTDAVRRIADHDRKIIEDLDNNKTELERQKKEVESKKAEVDADNKALASEKKALQSKVRVNNEHADDLKSDIDAYTKARQAAEAERKKWDKELDNFFAKQAASNIVYNGKGFAWPVPGYGFISSTFGDTENRYAGHGAIDIATNWSKQTSINGKPCVASAGGKVILKQWYGSYGNCIIIDHGDQDGRNYKTLYAHLSGYNISSGQTVTQGQVIGYVGSTGNSTGAHLHFEVRVNNARVNPLNYVRYGG